MPVNQAGQHNLLTEIENVAAMAGFHFCKATNACYLISSDRNRGILDRFAYHRHNNA